MNEILPIGTPVTCETDVFGLLHNFAAVVTGRNFMFDTVTRYIVTVPDEFRAGHGWETSVPADRIEVRS